MSNFTDDLINAMNNRKRDKINNFINEVKQRYIRDEEMTSKIYTRDKDKYPYKVYKLKSGMFALINNLTQEIYFKNECMHLCKVEFIIKSTIDNGTLAMFANKL